MKKTRENCEEKRKRRESFFLSFFSLGYLPFIHRERERERERERDMQQTLQQIIDERISFLKEQINPQNKSEENRTFQLQIDAIRSASAAAD